MKNLELEDFTSYLRVKRRMSDWTVTCHRSRFRITFKWMDENNLDFTAQAVESLYLHLKEKGLSAKGLNNYHHT